MPLNVWQNAVEMIFGPFCEPLASAVLMMTVREFELNILNVLLSGSLRLGYVFLTATELLGGRHILGRV